VAWANTYAVRMDYTSTADRAGNAVINRHRAPASRLLRVLEAVPNLRAAAFRQSGNEIGVEQLATLATSTTAATTLAGLCFNGLDGIAATARGLLLDANRGMAFVVDTSSAKEFALARWLVGGADGGRLFVRVFDGAANVRENIAGDVLASGTTMQWNAPAEGWNAGAVMADASLNRRQTIRVGAGGLLRQWASWASTARSSWRRCGCSDCRRRRRRCSMLAPQCRSAPAASGAPDPSGAAAAAWISRDRE